MNHLLYPVEELAECMDAKAFVQLPEAMVRTVLTDSRRLHDTDKALFFALRDRRDGHVFISEVYDTGVRSFVISDPDFDYGAFIGANFYLVEDTLKALQRLAAFHRKKFNYPVIGITGSNGKTVVKEWLYQLLSPEYTMVRSPKSYNSRLGVPLSVWEMDETNDLAIFEAGISTTGEMDMIAPVIRPTIGILTHIGEAHQEGFRSLSEKISEKLKLFEGVDLFIYSDKYLADYEGSIPGRRKFKWSYPVGEATLEVTDDQLPGINNHGLKADFDGREIHAVIPFTDQASVENAIVCWATMLALGYPPADVAKRLEMLQPISMRLELKNGINNCSVIDDSYSLDLSSLTIALDFLKQQNQHLNRTLILSDIPGADSGEVYDQVGEMIRSRSVNRLIGVGDKISRYAADLPCRKEFFTSTEEFLRVFPTLKFADETILLKGARRFGFERISRLLIQKVHETVLEINLTALQNNLNHYKSLLPPNTRIMAMVKAFSYGSGSFEIANLLEFNKIDYLAVAYADEGVALRKAGVSLPLMVMSPDLKAFDTIIENNLEPEIYSLRILHEFSELLSLKGKKNYPVHIKLDTGMHRLGFMEDDLDELLKVISQTDYMRIQSIFSHLVASEDPSQDDFTRHQISLFRKLSGRIISALDYPVIRHILNTSGISRMPESAFDMVRLGIGLYGIDAVLEDRSILQTVVSLKTTISQIKQVPAGDTVGYGRTGKMPEGGTIATVKIGYADGYSRRFGNGVGQMLVNGKKVKTVGRICMDMCMLDISGVDAEEGDEVVVFNDRIRVEDLAEQLGTIAYEVLTGISQRVKRVYYYE